MSQTDEMNKYLHWLSIAWSSSWIDENVHPNLASNCWRISNKDSTVCLWTWHFGHLKWFDIRQQLLARFGWTFSSIHDDDHAIDNQWRYLFISSVWDIIMVTHQQMLATYWHHSSKSSGDMKVTHPGESVFKNQSQEQTKHSAKHKLTEEDQQLLEKMRHEQNEPNADAAE